MGHWYPAGAVWSGSRDAKLLRQAQWNTSVEEKKKFTLHHSNRDGMLFFNAQQENKKISIHLYCFAFLNTITDKWKITGFIIWLNNSTKHQWLC